MWYDELKACINELIPLVEKYSARINPIDNKPPLWLFIISSNVSNVATFVDGGKILEIISINVSWKPSIGIYGIKVKKTIIEGKKAKKKLNANDDALVVIAPSCNPLKKNIVTSYILKPLNPKAVSYTHLTLPTTPYV